MLKIQELAIKKRLNSSGQWNYQKFKVFKGLTDDGHPEYRDYLAPSPTTAAAEAFILNSLCERLRSTRAENVYSYKLASKNSPHNYEYYLPHYQKRNEDILKNLKASGNSVALFLDIKNFYASVPKEDLISAIKHHDILGQTENTYIVDFLIDQINQSPSGIPIGSELSHILADAYLSKLDSILKNELKHCYFRYVDDITIIGKPQDVEKYEGLIKNQLDQIGLALNTTKRELFSANQWQEEMDTSPVDGEDFYTHCQQLGKWLDGDRKRLASLDSALKGEGFQIPINKIVTSQHSTPRTHKAEASEKEIILRSKNIREKYLNALDKVAENLSEKSNRWYLQKTKRALNPLFYLLNKEEYKTISDAAKGSKKLKPQEEVSKAIHLASCDSIISYPGVTIHTFCEIWRSTQPKELKISEFTTAAKNDAQIESLTTLSLFDILSPPKQVLESTSWRALQPNIKSISESLDGFDAEIEALRIGLTSKKQQDLFDNRLSDDEDLVLNGLELGNQSISP